MSLEEGRHLQWPARCFALPVPSLYSIRVLRALQLAE